MFFYFLQGLLYGFPLAATPGPLQAFLLSQTLKNGWRKTLPAALAPLLSDGPIIALVIFILAQVPDSALRFIRLAGGCFVLYLALGAYQSYRRTGDAQIEIQQETGSQNLFKATLTNFLSPGPYIFWSTVLGPILLQGWRESPSHGFLFLLGFYGTLIGGFALTILIFDLIGRLPPQATRLLSLISAVILLLFGLSQLWQALYS
jgi:threonine/homoserine/homoserine lactone efflux protein